MSIVKLRFRVNPLFIPIALLILAVPSMGQAREAEQPGTYMPSMKFDVASVRENKDIDPNGGITVGGGFTPNTTSLRIVNWDIENLISAAYGMQREQIVGIPKWPFPTMFMIEARSDTAADAKMAALKPEQQRAEKEHMLQQLLQDRFSLKTHWDTRDGDVYRLVVAKGGSKLSAAVTTEGSDRETKAVADQPLPPIYQKNDGQGYDFIAHACSMEQLVEILSGQFGRPVKDETELNSKYDFVLKYRGRWDRDRDASDLDPMPPLDRALEEQLGLKVEGAKGPVKKLVIDHIERPSEN